MKWFSVIKAQFQLMGLLLLFVTFNAIHLSAQELPPQSNPPRLVNDYAQVLTNEEEQQLETKLVAFNDSTSTQIAIVLISSTGEYPVDDYAIALFRNWGIGQKGKDNGVLILAAMQDRRMTIITGYGVEGALPDAICKRIIELTLKPAFKAQQYFNGLDEATTEIMLRTTGEFKADEKQKEQAPVWLPVLFVFLILFFVMLAKILSVKRYAALNNTPFWVAWMLLNAAANRRRQSRGSSWTGGSWGGGSSGWGSSGGFGGFGGGSTGGGGATGSW
jgi:uncharacterized protein